MLRSFRVEIDTPLTLSIDPEERCALVPRDHSVKGAFMIPKAQALGEDFAKLQPRLLAPPRLGRYLPFGDYPSVDCARLCFAAAVKAYPDLPLAEASRRLGRRDMLAFLASPSSREMFNFATEPEGALLALPGMYKSLQQGAVVSTRKRSNGAVRVEFNGAWAMLDNLHIGLIEAVVLHFGAKPTIDVKVLSIEHVTFDVSLT